ncbi:EI24 domain-containing protein [Actinomadura opuntiae]|uniref:EI24 domain-containing protein n=1 Tax=Actinomadura sp. OS1-43 TaxID=604315 RepID=UPI00255B0ECC|nr:EI24 domain-containing protein [Actinomadura sp. OS1-43]MDL4814573.1 EI24 domain-containing protein [Actinomadura sp. OS1-43]
MSAVPPNQPAPRNRPPGPRPPIPAPGSQSPAEPRPSAVKDLLNGVGYLLRGIGWTARNPAQWAFGLIPALIVLAAYAAALVTLAFYLDDLSGWVTPFADGWSEGARDSARVVAGIAIYGASVFLAVLTFTAVTLLVGDPFYEAIAVRVEESQGGAPPDPDVPLLVQIGRAIKDALLLGLVALLFAVVFFAAGFLPVVGQTVVPVIAALVSGYFLAGELTSIALERRGLRRRERFARLKADRPLVVGFGAATFVVFLIPFGAVLAMPGAVAGATLLARERLADGPVLTAGDGGVAGRH